MNHSVKIFATLSTLFIGLFLFPLYNAPAAHPDEANFAPKNSSDNSQEPVDIADWSTIVFQSTRDGNSELYRARGDGTQPVRITYTEGLDEMNPALNRGATQIIYEVEVKGNLDLYRINIDGSGQVRLTTNKAPDYDAEWSPDGTKIAFVSERSGNAEIYLMNPDGTGVVRLTNNDYIDVSPTWSQVGDLIAWVQKDNPNRGRLWMMDADGGRPGPVTGDYAPSVSHVRWSPNGSFLVCDGDFDLDGQLEIYKFILQYNQSYTLYNVNIPGVQIQLGGWSPDSKWVTFTYTELSTGKSYLEKIEQSEYVKPSVRLPGSGYDSAPSWRSGDILPPVTALLSLPPYSPASGFQIELLGYDPGLSGMAGNQVEVRTVSGWSQLDGPIPVPQTVYDFWGTSGLTYYFRSRAVDNAGNYEAWPPGDQGETQTTLYSVMLDGKVTDNRQQPLPKTSLILTPTSLNPLITNENGRYQAYLGSTGQHQLRTGKNGYGAFLPTPLQIDLDTRLNLYLRPEDDLIQNGSFESGLTGWSIDGTIPFTGTTSVAHSGIKSLPLGHACAPLCFNPLYEFVNNPHRSQLVTDRDGGIHIVYVTYEQGGAIIELHYIWRSPAGLWSTPETITHIPCGIPIQLEIDGLKGLHIVGVCGQNDLYYIERSPAGIWSVPKTIGSCSFPSAVADRHGGVHVVCSGLGGAYYYEKILYYEKTPSGNWKSPVIVDSLGNKYPSIAIGPDDTLHFLWQRIDEGIFYRSRLANGDLTPIRQLYSGQAETGDTLRIAVGPQDEVHTYWTWWDVGYYAFRGQYQKWTQAIPLPLISDHANMVVDSQGILHMFGIYYLGDPMCYYRYKTQKEGWSHPIMWSICDKFSFGPHDSINYIGYDPDTYMAGYVTSQIAEQDEYLTASQEIVIPQDMIHSTLAFQYQMLNSVPEGQTHLRVSVSDPVSSTIVFTATTSGAAWAQGFADLQAWAGKTVTVTFSLNQAAGELLANVHLDDVTLGSWLTPVVESATPRLLLNWANATITLSGDNFITTPMVRIGNTPSPAVAWLDEHTLQVRIPPSLAPGTYDIWVTNPGGQENVLLSGVQLGVFNYLPIIYQQ